MIVTSLFNRWVYERYFGVEGTMKRKLKPPPLTPEQIAERRDARFRHEAEVMIEQFKNNRVVLLMSGVGGTMDIAMEHAYRAGLDRNAAEITTLRRKCRNYKRTIHAQSVRPRHRLRGAVGDHDWRV